MNQKKKLLILCAVMVVLLAAFLIIKTSNDAAEAEQLAIEEQEALDSIIYVSEMDSTTVTEVSWTYTDTMAFELVEDVWAYGDDNAFPLDTSYVTAVVAGFSTVVADRELTAEEGLDSYGLETPLYEVALTDSTGTTNTFYIGNVTSDDTYYVTMNDKSSVYTVSSDVVTTMMYGLLDMIVNDTFIYVTSDQITEVKKTIGETEVIYTSEYTDSFDLVASGLELLAFDTCVDYATDDETLSAYDLDEESRLELVISYDVTTTETADDGTEETTVESYEATMYIGAGDETGENYYIQVGGSGLVYTMPYDTVIYLICS